MVPVVSLDDLCSVSLAVFGVVVVDYVVNW